MDRIEVVAAVIVRDGKVFATRRGYGEYKHFWEFPGGKIEPGETPPQALEREILEELSTRISVGEPLHVIEWDYPSFHLTMHCFVCTLDPHQLHLNEHEEARWLDADGIRDVCWLPADQVILPLVCGVLSGVPVSLVRYAGDSIIPSYAAFDKAHREDHAAAVIERALSLTKYYDVDKAMVFTAAACHDLGLVAGRETHHLESGKIIRSDSRLAEWFSPGQIEEIARAAEDHRASSDHAPRSVYGRIVAEADRLIEPETIIRRTIQYGLSHYPGLDREGHWERTLEHLREKYGDGGYLKLWIPESPNAARLEQLRVIIRDEARLRQVFEKLYAEETQ